MAYPRSQPVSDEEPGFYHCVSRCVHRAFLGGVDGQPGKSFKHRRQWIRERIFKLAESFAVSVYAYAVAQANLPGRFARKRKTSHRVPYSAARSRPRNDEIPSFNSLTTPSD